MPHLFESKDSFKESFKDAVSDAYGRDFEDTYPEERYIVLGNMIRDLPESIGEKLKMRSRKQNQNSFIIFYGILDGSFND